MQDSEFHFVGFHEFTVCLFSQSAGILLNDDTATSPSWADVYLNYNLAPSGTGELIKDTTNFICFNFAASASSTTLQW